MCAITYFRGRLERQRVMSCSNRISFIRGRLTQKKKKRKKATQCFYGDPHLEAMFHRPPTASIVLRRDVLLIQRAIIVTFMKQFSRKGRQRDFFFTAGQTSQLRKNKQQSVMSRTKVRTRAAAINRYEAINPKVFDA